MSWPEEEVVVQQGCSRLEELGLFPCSRPTAKVRVLIHIILSLGYNFQIMRIHLYGGRLISIVGSRFNEVLRAFLWILMRYCRHP